MHVDNEPASSNAENWTVTEGSFPGCDGTPLFYRTWRPRLPCRKALILLHRGHEHSGRLLDVVNGLGLTEAWAFAFDLRGHGRSPGERGYADRFDVWTRDLDAFVRHVCLQHDLPIENLAIVANSLGAVTACAWVHDYAPRIRSLVLVAPAFRIKLYVPLAIPLLKLLQVFRKKAFIASYVRARMLTHDPEEIRRYEADPLITRRIAVRVLLDMHATATRVLADAGAIVVPTAMLVAGRDFVVQRAAQMRFLRARGATGSQFHEYPELCHALLHERDRAQPLAAIRDFVRKAFETEPDRSRLLVADQQGYTYAEYTRLKRPAGLIATVYFGVQRVAMRTLGRLSEGIRIGCDSGFDSGLSLDYVYANQARGCTFVGRAIDRGYLNAIGWRGVRERKANLMLLLRAAIAQCHRLSPGESVRVLDVASGPGRYLMETVAALGPECMVELMLRDNAPANLDAARRLAGTMGLANVRVDWGDAFDAVALAALRPRPHIVIVSGLYELFPDNAPVRASLRALAAVLEPGGFLLYTGQPWHPQLEMIARVLVNREHAPWIMRRRTQAELDELVASVGLKKIDSRVESNGIFTVSMAQKGTDA